MSELYRQEIIESMTEEERQRLKEPPAWENTKRPFGFPLGATAFQFTGHFHQLMGLPAPERPIIPPISDRNLRACLIFEEFQELLDAMGFQIMLGQAPVRFGDQLRVEHIEGSRYDLVETADALGDLNVVVAGTGVSFGIPMHFIDYEVYCSNLTKLDENGNPIVNECIDEDCLNERREEDDRTGHGLAICEEPEHFRDPKAPLGKRLKPAGFVPTNIPRVLLAYIDKEI